jgi:hypothetical protein
MRGRAVCGTAALLLALITLAGHHEMVVHLLLQGTLCDVR